MARWGRKQVGRDQVGRDQVGEGPGGGVARWEGTRWGRDQVGEGPGGGGTRWGRDQVGEGPGGMRVPLSHHRGDTPSKDAPPPKRTENRKQVQSLSGLFGSAPIRRSETPADKKKQLFSKQGTHQSIPDQLLEDISLEDFESNSQDAERKKVCVWCVCVCVCVCVVWVCGVGVCMCGVGVWCVCVVWMCGVGVWCGCGVGLCSVGVVWVWCGFV